MSDDISSGHRIAFLTPTRILHYQSKGSVKCNKYDLSFQTKKKKIGGADDKKGSGRAKI